ncbi:hypoxanthine phosphoribosyltransferase [Candidatus Ishikawella capsulata]|uniref:Hypoxanthine phosphoribosyltransferase n=1 Tax=Candidatus Ishikawaella capsulata Mpkobe TaxID=476281 RepID=C5WCM2_9ENTR|nr:hypoxanthine phosphoribosyltransferase [Candidatus Ishikawaella capsulata]BAH83078.1 hypoxanthine-guanine phosphoribosyltransferase [Candidatus Ishikawaella capsulata Mpkobe]
MKHIVEVLIDRNKLNARVIELGKEIAEHYQNNNNKMVLIGLLRGSFIFMADLCRNIKIEHEIDFMTTSSYDNHMYASHDVKILKDLDENIYGKDVLLVEDIIDSGNTLNKVREILFLRQPKSLSICALLSKPQHRKVNIAVKFVGFSIPDVFVVGYGLDYAQNYRYLPYIGKVVMINE